MTEPMMTIEEIDAEYKRAFRARQEELGTLWLPALDPVRMEIAELHRQRCIALTNHRKSVESDAANVAIGPREERVCRDCHRPLHKKPGPGRWPVIRRTGEGCRADVAAWTL